LKRYTHTNTLLSQKSKYENIVIIYTTFEKKQVSFHHKQLISRHFMNNTVENEMKMGCIYIDPTQITHSTPGQIFLPVIQFIITIPLGKKVIFQATHTHTQITIHTLIAVLPQNLWRTS
jgi:hypothetical protein